MELKNVITLKNVRISFMKTLWKADKVNESDSRATHKVHAILSPDDPQLKAVRALIRKVASEFPKWQTVDPKTKKAAWEVILAQLEAQDKVCLHSGDTKAQYDGYAGNYFVSGSNEATVTVLDRDKTPLGPDDGRPYGGCYCDMNFQIWAQDNKWGKRINATIRWVQFRRGGDAFTGTPPASEDEIPDLSAEEDEDDVPLA